MSSGVRRAAVSLIEREDGALLCVWNERYRGWSLPGGMVEEGESIEAAQERELREETGLETLGRKQVFEGEHGLTALSEARPGRASYVHVFRVEWDRSDRPEPVETALLWLLPSEFVRLSPFGSFYRKVFAVIYPEPEKVLPSPEIVRGLAETLEECIARIGAVGRASTSNSEALEARYAIEDLQTRLRGLETTEDSDGEDVEVAEVPDRSGQSGRTGGETGLPDEAGEREGGARRPEDRHHEHGDGGELEGVGSAEQEAEGREGEGGDRDRRSAARVARGALRLEATPTLYGEDAVRLLADLENVCTPEEARKHVEKAEMFLAEMSRPKQGSVETFETRALREKGMCGFIKVWQKDRAKVACILELGHDDGIHEPPPVPREEP